MLVMSRQHQIGNHTVIECMKLRVILLLQSMPCWITARDSWTGPWHNPITKTSMVCL